MEGPNLNKGQTPKKGFSVPKNPNSGVKEGYENECNKLQSPKKPVPKHLMSPTISAASKVSTPRKKILGERNGIPSFSDPHSLKSPGLLPRTDRSGPMMISSYSCAADSDAVAAYDPASSYLSPRPKYLRYNPSRKREVLLQLQSMGGGNEGDEFGGEEMDFQNVEEEAEKSEIIQSLDVKETDVVDSENGISQGVVKMDNCEEEVEENDDDLNAGTAEEGEEVHGWSLKRILKFLVVLSIFVLATTVLNSDSEGITMIEDQTGYGLAHDFRVGNHSLADESEAQSNGHLFDMVEYEITNFQNSGPDMLEEATLRELTDSHGRQSEVDMEFYYGNEESEERTPEVLVEADMVGSEVDDMVEDAPEREFTDHMVEEESINNTMAAENMKIQKPKNRIIILLVVLGAMVIILSGFWVSLLCSNGRKSEEMTPTVKLLCEMVVREVERSLRRCDQKVGDELIESEESSNFIERKKISNPPPALDYSIADSPSCYGSFTTEAKFLKKENGKDAEITTPVRRSNRIRSRSVTLSHES